LEWVAALLQELLVLSRILCLLCLLAESSRTNLRLRALQCSLLRARSKPSNLLTCLHLASEIRSHNALLRLSSLYCLPIALLVERRDSLPKGKVLLPLKLRALQASSLTTKSPTLDGLCLLLGKLLALLLLKSLNRWVNNGLSIWVLVVSDLALRQRANILRPRQRQSCAYAIVGLRKLRSPASGVDPCRLDGV
jgi:hypothetical protein